MSSTSDSRVDTSDRDPYDAEPVRSDPWASGPGHLSQDENETERFVPEQRDGDHDGHLYASDTYAEPETEVLADERGKDASAQTHADEPTAVGVAHVDSDGKVDGSDESTAVVTHPDETTDDTSTADDAAAKADQSEAEAEEEAEADAEDARADAEEARTHSGADYDEARVGETAAHEPTADTEPESQPEPVVQTVPLPAAEQVAVVEPVADRPADGEHVAVVPVATERFGGPTVAEPVTAEPGVAESEDLVAVPVAAADEPAGDLKPGDVPVAPVAGFLTADAAQGLRDRWREAQLGFVDDPRKAVDDVKALVTEAVDQFTSALSAQRDELDAAAGEDTEQYRVAVRRYRAFFDRLLDL
jgi:hypothetical protein